MLNGTVTHSLVFDKHDKGIDNSIRDSLRVFYQRNIFIDQLSTNPKCGIIESTEDNCLRKTSDLGFDYCILTWEGNIFNIYLFHEMCIKFIEDLDNKTNGHWLVAGQIIDQHKNRILYQDKTSEDWKNSYWLYPITAIVNLKTWRKLGKPVWGSEGVSTVIKGKPSDENVHDTYTPVVLNSYNEEVTAKVKKGWNIIDCSLRNNIPVYNLSSEIRTAQTHLYPEVDIQKYNDFWSHLFNLPKLTDNYRKVLQSIISSKFPERIDPNTWQCFIKNTEDYFPAINNPEAIIKVDSIVTPCSGFKDFIVTMSDKSNYRPRQIVHYDILPECVKIKKRITEEWDGTRVGFTNLLTEIQKDYETMGKKNCFHMNAMKTYDEAYQDILKFFVNEDQVKERWLEFKNYDHQWIHADILEQDGAISVKKLINGKTIYLCLSDIASWRNNILGYGYRNLRNNIAKTINIFVNSGINGVIDYKDPGTDRQKWQSFNQATTYLELPPTHETY